MQPGAHGIVRHLHGDAYFITVLASRGITVGAKLEVLRNSAHSPLLLMVRDVRLALGRNEAAAIEVELVAKGNKSIRPPRLRKRR